MTRNEIEYIYNSLSAGLSYAEDVIASPEHLKCFKKGVVQRNVRDIKKAMVICERDLNNLK